MKTLRVYDWAFLTCAAVATLAAGCASTAEPAPAEERVGRAESAATRADGGVGNGNGNGNGPGNGNGNGNGPGNGNAFGRATPGEAARMQQHLRDLVDATDVKHRFRSAAGDDIACVSIHGQPAHKNPKIGRGHALKVAPDTAPASLPSTAPDAGYAMLAGDPDAQGRARQCPPQTVPMMEQGMDTLTRFETLEGYKKKAPRGGPGDGIVPGPTFAPPALGSTALHQYAVAGQTVDNRGVEAVLNLWSPFTEVASEFSLSQIWIFGDALAGTQTVEAGWQRYPDLYGDSRARLFIYSTQDGYLGTGCYNLTCGQFVQVDPSVYIGGPFDAYSTAGGTQREARLLWFKDGPAGHWWLRFGTKWIGYYPRSLFSTPGIADKASAIELGGEVVDNRTGDRHTHTDMGSGAFPASGYRYSAYQRNVRYVDANNFYAEPTSLWTWRTSSACYDVSVHNDPVSWGRYVFFGGAGYNPSCQ